MYSSFAATSEQQHGGTSSLSVRETVVAVLVPLLLIISLMILFIFCCRRKRRARRRQSATPTAETSTLHSGNGTFSERVSDYSRRFGNFIRDPQSRWRTTSEESVGTAGATSATVDSEQTRVHVRATTRRQRPRRTDSGATVKTLPEYNELGDDEVMLFKAINSAGEVSVTDLEEGRANTPPARQLSLRAVADLFRRIPLRRSGSPHPNNNEMDDMSERTNANEARAVPEEESGTTPQEEAPHYSQLYPTVPPQIQVSDIEASDENLNNRRSTTRSILRRSGSQQDGLLGGMDMFTTDSTIDLRLTATRSTDLGLNRPSFSSSRRMLGVFLNNASSTSLLSHSGNDDSELTNRSTTNLSRHQRNISAPIQARRLQFVPPAAGFSERQMQFLTSVESLDRYGIPIQQEGQHQDVPPSFEQLARSQERNLMPTAHSAPILSPAELYHDEVRTPLPSLPELAAPSASSTSSNAATSASTTTSVS